MNLIRIVGVITAGVLPLTACGVLRGSNVVTSAPAAMQVSSGSFINGVLPEQYTCYSRTPPPVNPPLSWSGAPSATRSVAVVVDDSSAPITPEIYWIVFDISPATTTILQGQLPPGARQARDSAGLAAYDAPCPSGKPHLYRFTVYALDTMLKLPQGTSLESAWTKIAAATIGRGRATVKAVPRPLCLVRPQSWRFARQVALWVVTIGVQAGSSGARASGGGSRLWSRAPR